MWNNALEVSPYGSGYVTCVQEECEEQEDNEKQEEECKTVKKKPVVSCKTYHGEVVEEWRQWFG